jgi:AcrR family transcriptional regulator
MMSRMTADGKPSKARNRTRSETMDLLRASALELLATIDPEALTIREISDHAGVFHRYIPDYFGGKAELLADIYPTAREQARGGLVLLDGDGVRPEVIRLARLAVWLSANRDTGVPADGRPLTQSLVTTLTEQTGLDEGTALLVAQRVMAGVIVLAAFPDVISNEPIDVTAHRDLELRIVRLLAQDSASRNV